MRELSPQATQACRKLTKIVSLRIDGPCNGALRVYRVTRAACAGLGSVEIQVTRHQADGLDKRVFVRDAGGRGLACHLPAIIDSQPNRRAAERAEVLHGNGLRIGGNCERRRQHECSGFHVM